MQCIENLGALPQYAVQAKYHVHDRSLTVLLRYSRYITIAPFILRMSLEVRNLRVDDVLLPVVASSSPLLNLSEKSTTEGATQLSGKAGINLTEEPTSKNGPTDMKTMFDHELVNLWYDILVSITIAFVWNIDMFVLCHHSKASFHSSY